MVMFHVRLQLRFVYARVWQTGDDLQMQPYVPPISSQCPSLVTSDDGACGHDTNTFSLEHVLCKPHIDPRHGAHLCILRLIAEGCPCEETCYLLEFLMGNIRLGADAPLVQGHLLATIRR